MKNKIKLIIDSLLMLSMLYIMVPMILGQSIHEWTGLIIAALIIIHLGLNWNWLKHVTLKFLHRLPVRIRLNYLLSCLLLVGFAGLAVSGLFIAKTIDLSWLGITRGSGMVWKPLHTSLAFLTFLFTGLHIGISWSGYLRLLKPAGNQNDPMIKGTAGKLAEAVLAVALLVAGIFSFSHLDYWDKSNPVRVVEAINLSGTDPGEIRQGLTGLGQEGRRHGQGMPGPGHARGQKEGANSRALGEAAAFSGVIISTAMVAYLIDRTCKNKKIVTIATR